ncbi:MAG: Rieske (2Fe-2S) protein [Thermoplasmatota archaeon]
MGGWHAAVALADLADGIPRLVHVAHEPVVLIRLANDIFAAQGLCPHKFGSLAEGRLEGWRLTCPLHAATFDIRTGVAQPGGVWGGALPLYPSRVREGQVEVQIP